MHAQLAPRTAAREALLSLEFSRQEYWSGVPFSTPGDLPNPGMEPGSPASAGGFFTTAPPGKPECLFISSLMAGPGLRCGSGFSLAVVIGGCSSLQGVGFSLQWLLLWSTGSRAHGLSSCRVRAWLRQGMWDLPRPGIESVPPALAGRFFTIEPAGEPKRELFESPKVLPHGGSWLTICIVFLANFGGDKCDTSWGISSAHNSFSFTPVCTPNPRSQVR